LLFDKTGLTLYKILVKSNNMCSSEDLHFVVRHKELSCMKENFRKSFFCSLFEPKRPFHHLNKSQPMPILHSWLKDSLLWVGNLKLYYDWMWLKFCFYNKTFMLLDNCFSLNSVKNFIIGLTNVCLSFCWQRMYPVIYGFYETFSLVYGILLIQS